MPTLTVPKTAYHNLIRVCPRYANPKSNRIELSLINENSIYHLHVLRCNALIELIGVYCLILCNATILLSIGVFVGRE